jgi:hypothetical protein
MKDEQLNKFLAYEDIQYIKELESKIKINISEIGVLTQQISDLESTNREYHEKICRIKNKATLLVYANCPHEWEKTQTGQGPHCIYGNWCEHGKPHNEYYDSGYYGYAKYHIVCKICGLVEGQPINFKTC